MAVVHRTTLEPGKLDLLTAWLPSRDWFTGAVPRLHRAGGFRLDDPAGEVGIECMIVIDTADPHLPVYHVPLTYRGAPLPGGDLVGTTEHGVLGHRWVYDGASDPVAVAQLTALLTGSAVAQHQDRSYTPADTVECFTAQPDPGLSVRIDRIPATRAEIPGARVICSWTDPAGSAARGVVLQASTDSAGGDTVG